MNTPTEKCNDTKISNTIYIYNKMLETKVSNINTSEIIDLIHKGIESYKNEQRIGE